MVDARHLLLEILNELHNETKWTNARFGKIKILANTKVGEAGELLVERLCRELGFEVDFPQIEGRRTSRAGWDIMIEQVRFEVKAATEDLNGKYQFNHIRYHRDYDAVLCVGISPADIFAGAWSKRAIEAGAAGTLATMDRGSDATYKLTKSPSDLRDIDEFYDVVMDVVIELEIQR